MSWYHLGWALCPLYSICSPHMATWLLSWAWTQGDLDKRWGHGSTAPTLLCLFLNWRVSKECRWDMGGGYRTVFRVQLPFLLPAALLIHTGGLNSLCESKQSHCRLP